MGNEKHKESNNMSDNRYKMFRNFMTNELQLTKSDIEDWTKEAVEETVRNILSQYNVESMIEHIIKRIIIERLPRNTNIDVLLRTELGRYITDNFDITITPKKRN